jgi:hypothetical protein
MIWGPLFQLQLDTSTENISTHQPPLRSPARVSRRELRCCTYKQRRSKIIKICAPSGLNFGQLPMNFILINQSDIHQQN